MNLHSIKLIHPVLLSEILERKFMLLMGNKLEIMNHGSKVRHGQKNSSNLVASKGTIKL